MFTFDIPTRFKYKEESIEGLAVSHDIALEPQSKLCALPTEGPAARDDIALELQSKLCALPTEILRAILSTLKPDAIANFRLTCSRCAAVGYEYLYADGKARIPLCPEVGARLYILSEQCVGWRVKDIEVTGNMDDLVRRGPLAAVGYGRDSIRLQPESIPHGSKIANLQSLEVRLQPSPQIKQEQWQFHPTLSELVFYFLFDLIVVLGVRMVSLRLVNVGWRIPNTTVATLLNAFACLERLELVDYPGPLLPNQRSLPVYLLSMKRLKDLTIDFSRTSNSSRDEMSFVCNLRFAHLRSLRFSNVTIEQQSLLRFLGNHRHLESLHLGATTLRNGSWNEAIWEMSRTVPNLKSIKFSGKHFYGQAVDEAWICSHNITTYIETFTWRGVGLASPPRAHRVSDREMNTEFRVRKEREAARKLRPEDVCKNCGVLKDFYRPVR